ncbi:hybrid sensor histidine kinase/response regulator [Desulfatitalea alkaliphila]|uniref:histidine kinase n=1 Tax=Desulfatitalea alkaliphila TaxID=2929485 RepID=A0AA41UJY2_9BACT|nr:PAS domain S-box protein [Desulfatitalea alkaliphila]MCJ8502455.1 PAS domain S-box protein [Desulfatitalea alkaliphila]
MDKKIQNLSALFALMGSDPAYNMRTIVQQLNPLIDCACAFYAQLADEKEWLAAWSGEDRPADFPPATAPAGRLLQDCILRADRQPTHLPDIAQSPYLESDPYLVRWGLKTFLGRPVTCDGHAIGVLCIADTRQRPFTETQQEILAILAKLLSIEEERRRTARSLRGSEAQCRQQNTMLHLITDNVPDLIWAKDRQGRYLFANQPLCDTLLKCERPEAVIGKTDAAFFENERRLGHRHTFPEQGDDSDALTLQRKVAGRFLEQGLVRGEYLALDIHKAPFWDDQGNLCGTVGCGRDVTHEQRTEKALQESERRYRELYHNTPVMLYSLDKADRITDASNLWLETMGYTREEVIGRSALDYFAPESRKDAVEIFMPEFYRTGRMKNRSFDFCTKDGTVKQVQLSAIAQRDAEGRYAGALAFVVDLSQTKASELEQRRLSARLQQAQKMEAIATLAGGIAHQFNNALAVILGNLELIQMDGLADQKIKRFVDPISQAGQKMVHLTSQLLAYARGGKFQTQVVPSHTFVQEALGLVSHSIASQVEVQTDLDPDAAAIEVDATQMQMLLAAILSNASEAMDHKGAVHIALRNVTVTPEECLHHQGLTPGPRVLLRIADDGKGMDETTRARIFEPFYTTKFQGRGLGMAAVYGIVKKHGGYVAVASEPGQGTTVSIFLPRAEPLPEVAALRPPSPTRRSGTALIVEDEQLVMEVNRAIVEKLGYEVLEAKSGTEALAVARDHAATIDFALLDVILPDMSGNQIYPKLMAMIPNLKVIVCSGYTLDGPAREILNAGAESFLPKPFTVAALANTLDRIMANGNEKPDNTPA